MTRTDSDFGLSIALCPLLVAGVVGVLFAACSDATPEGEIDELRVIAGPLNEDADRVVVALSGTGIVDESLGAWPPIDADSHTANLVFESVPEGPKQIYATSFGPIELTGHNFPSGLVRCYDYANADIDVMGTVSGLVDLTMSSTWPGEELPVGSSQVGFDRVALDSAYTFDPNLVFGGSFDGSSIAVVAIDGGTAGGTVTVEEQGGGDEGRVGVFSSLPEPGLWPSVDTWSDQLNVVLDGDGDGIAIIVVKPNPSGRSVRIRISGAGVSQSACLVRLVGHAELTVTAE